LESKIQQYIDQFVDLNDAHGRTVEVAEKKLQGTLDERIVDFQGLLHQSIQKVLGILAQERTKLDVNKKELQNYATHVHNEFEKAELKRVEDKQMDVLLVKEIKEENQGLKKAIELQEKAIEDLKAQARENNKKSTLARLEKRGRSVMM